MTVRIVLALSFLWLFESVKNVRVFVLPDASWDHGSYGFIFSLNLDGGNLSKYLVRFVSYLDPLSLLHRGSDQLGAAGKEFFLTESPLKRTYEDIPAS